MALVTFVEETITVEDKLRNKVSSFDRAAFSYSAVQTPL